jgi:alkanesulfonate monooxygenase SsuD/methylene tetrahydromethanopterin reductase-like flavin-dependent oxidoreductase (luciferase family)
MNMTDDSYRWYNERFSEAGARVRELDEMYANHSMILGGPTTCIEGVQWFADQGVDMLLLSVQNGSTEHDDICDALVRFGNEVLPKFA